MSVTRLHTPGPQQPSVRETVEPALPVDLSRYEQRGYQPGAGILRRLAWYACNALLFQSWLLPLSAPKVWLLRLFGARIGSGVVIKPRVNIKHPWRLQVGDHVWVGEGVWIDNLVNVSIEAHVCLSQEAYLLTGNHDYRDPRFGLIVEPIVIEAGAWVGARAVVCPGVRVARGCVVTAASLVNHDTTPMTVWGGHPARPLRSRLPPAAAAR